MSLLKMGVSINLTLPDYVIGGQPATPHSTRLTLFFNGSRLPSSLLKLGP